MDSDPGVSGPYCDDEHGKEGGGDSGGADVWLYPVDFINYFSLLALADGGFAEKETVVFVAGKLSAIGDQGDKAGGEDGPYDD